MTRIEYLTKLVKERVLLLDGAMGTSIQNKKLENSDFNTSFLDGKNREFPGFGELLNISRPDVIFDIHQSFLLAGADIITTNTFCSNSITLKEYNLENYVKELNQSAVEIARAAAEDIEANNESKFVFVAGSMGPTGKMLSFSTDSEDVVKREYYFDDFKNSYKEQALVLLETHCDILLIETVFDTLICKAALEGIREATLECGIEKPIMVSVTFSDVSGHTLSGQTLEAFCTSLSTYPIFSIGMNCSMGAKEMIPLIEKMSQIAPFKVSAHPNAGLPLADGTYGQSPKQMVELLSPILKEGLVNIIGGCCGTDSEHIRALNELLNTVDENGDLICRPREIRNEKINIINLCGLEKLEKQNRLMIVGERCNVAGSMKFETLIKDKQWEDALEIARIQALGNADVIDICMDNSMIDGPSSMTTFLRHLNCDPSISKKPFMIDSSQWETIVVALKELQGRCIVNSISLKEGVAQFIEKAKFINNYGHAMVVMLFDEKGQADSYERKIEIAKRSYDLLVKNGINRESIIFDPNVLTIATGIDESDSYALAFINAVKWIKENLVGSSVCGGISNLSFSFRGNNPLRRAMHTIFIHHARKAGLDYAIIAPTLNLDINKIPVDVKTIIEKAILEPSIENREKLIEIATSNIFGKKIATKKEDIQKDLNTPKKRVENAICLGGSSSLENDIKLLLEDVQRENNSPVSIVEGPLMDAMAIVGEKFSKGEMFLPQVVKSARTMKLAVSYLQPAIERWKLDNEVETASSANTVVFATVKGDVHDIGKNICILVLRCNGFNVIDLGVMVPAQKIIETAIQEKANLVCLSGLITPSLNQMKNVCELAKKENLSMPILVGGATTSEEHTILNLAPCYDYRVFHATNASDLSTFALNLIQGGDAEILKISKTYKEKEKLLKLKNNNFENNSVISFNSALKNRFIKKDKSLVPSFVGVRVLKNINFEEIENLINWKMFAFSYGVPPKGPEFESLIEDAKVFLLRKEVKEVLSKALKGVYGIFPCSSDGITIKVDNKEKFTFTRQEKEGITYSLADYSKSEDFIGMYIVSGGINIDQHKSLFDEGEFLMLKLISTRLAEALSEKTAQILEKEWGSPILRPAPGYPSCPNHYHKKGIFKLLDGEKNTEVRLNENYMMIPEASICSFAFQGESLRYFNVGKIGKEQIEKISKIQNLSKEKLIELGIVEQ